MKINIFIGAKQVLRKKKEERKKEKVSRTVVPDRHYSYNEISNHIFNTIRSKYKNAENNNYETRKQMD